MAKDAIDSVPDNREASENSLAADALAPKSTFNKNADPSKTDKPVFNADDARRRVGDKEDLAALYAYLLDIGQITDFDKNSLSDEAKQFLETEGLTAEFDHYLEFAGQGENYESDLREYIEKTPIDHIDPSYIYSQGFDELKRIEHAAPHLIKKVQQALMDQGLYVTDTGHRFYLDGKIGREASSITWFGIRNGADQSNALAQETITNTVTSASAGEHVKLRAEIAFNKRDGNTGPVGGAQMAQPHAQALMVEAEKDGVEIGRGAMRLLDRAALSEGTLDEWAAQDEHRQETLTYIRENAFEPGQFDAAKFGSRDNATYAAMKAAVEFHEGLEVAGYKAEDFGLKTLGAFAYIESRYGHHPNTYKDNPAERSSASGLLQATKSYAAERYARFGTQMSAGPLLGHDNVMELRNDDRFLSEMVLLENMNNIPSLTSAMNEMENSASGYSTETRMITHLYLEHNIGKGGHDWFMQALRENPDQNIVAYLAKRNKGDPILTKNNPKFFYENGRLDGRQLTAKEAYQKYMASIQTGLNYHATAAEKFDRTLPNYAQDGGLVLGEVAPGYEMRSGFGYRTHPTTGEPNSFHSGEDFATPVGTPLRAPAHGVIADIDFNGDPRGYGGVAMISHGQGVFTLLAHLDRSTIRQFREGQIVKAGNPVAISGRTGRGTGAHVHAETIIVDERTGKAYEVDPAKARQLDLSDPAARQALIDDARARFGDHAISNAYAVRIQGDFDPGHYASALAALNPKPTKAEVAAAKGQKAFAEVAPAPVDVAAAGSPAPEAAPRARG